MATVSSFPLAVRVPVPTSHWDGALAVDLFAPEGTPALAVWDGEAIPTDYPLGGATVRLVADDGTEAYYAHLREAGRVRGRVQAGQVIGLVSDTGNARGRGAHLHLALGQIDANGGGTIAPWDVLGAAPVSSPTAGPGQRSWLPLLLGALVVAWALDLGEG